MFWVKRENELKWGKISKGVWNDDKCNRICLSNLRKVILKGLRIRRIFVSNWWIYVYSDVFFGYLFWIYWKEYFRIFNRIRKNYLILSILVRW